LDFFGCAKHKLNVKILASKTKKIKLNDTHGDGKLLENQKSNRNFRGTKTKMLKYL